jgi:hypothetical protein
VSSIDSISVTDINHAKGAAFFAEILGLSSISATGEKASSEIAAIEALCSGDVSGIKSGYGIAEIRAISELVATGEHQLEGHSYDSVIGSVGSVDAEGEKAGLYRSNQYAAFSFSIDHSKTVIVLNRPILSTSLTLTAESTSFLIEEALPGHVLSGETLTYLHEDSQLGIETSGDNLSYEVND